MWPTCKHNGYIRCVIEEVGKLATSPLLSWDPTLGRKPKSAHMLQSSLPGSIVLITTMSAITRPTICSLVTHGHVHPV